ncbi:MAG TPA: DUF1800 domain-containing protein [Pirellulales bacterium]|jgi:uncharacterized protein (DUF1800 family)|nr:DUF1800 domain-containing protein [Pirellulales bacterium]
MSLVSRREFGHWAACAAGALSLSGCAPWEAAHPERDLSHLADQPPATPAEWRILNRLTFGPRRADLARLRRLGPDGWIDEQLRPATIAEADDLLAALAELETLNADPEEAHDRETDWETAEAIAPIWQYVSKVGKPGRIPRVGQVRHELAQATVLRATFSNRALQAVLVEFWTDHFCINDAHDQCRWLKSADDRHLRPLALGKFRDLLSASMHSPAMLCYLDNFENRRRDDATGAKPNENYARELLELHTLGDTSAYTIRDIQEVARILTGWSVGSGWGEPYGEFVFRPDEHDDGAKVVLGQTYPAGQGLRDGEQLLEQLANHPQTVAHLVKKLCARFVGVAPSSLHDRLAQTYRTSGGEISAVLAELFRSPEFRDGTEPLLKRPFHFAVSALRGLGANTSGAGIVTHLEAMGQRPFAWARPDGYPRDAESWAEGFLPRWNFALALVQNQIAETWIELESLDQFAQHRTPQQICRCLSERLLAKPLSETELASLARLNAPRSPDALQQQLALLLMSPQFQWS